MEGGQGGHLGGPGWRRTKQAKRAIRPGTVKTHSEKRGGRGDEPGEKHGHGLDLNRSNVTA